MLHLFVREPKRRIRRLPRHKLRQRSGTIFDKAVPAKQHGAVGIRNSSRRDQQRAGQTVSRPFHIVPNENHSPDKY
jgi:hypothetical protein